MEFDIKEHCHVNSNTGEDRFVGIKIDSGHGMAYFPMGYALPESDAAIRTDIRHLIQVLSEFTEKDERLVSCRQFEKQRQVEFPVNAYRTVMEYYFAIGGNYYVESDPAYRTASTGKQDWPRTIRSQTPLIKRQGDVSSFIFTSFTVRTVTPNDTKLITQINRFCVFEAFQKLGWLYVPYLPGEPGPHPDMRTAIAIVQSRLCGTNDDRKRALFQAMKDMLAYMDEEASQEQIYYGTYHFEYVWEKLIDRVFGEAHKEQYFPRTRWLLDYGQDKEKRPLMPDTVMVYQGKYYVLDAKYYRYGLTGNPDHLPDGSSINKQITYGEYVERTKDAASSSLFNAFIMPFSQAENYFHITSTVGNIGEAVGDWRENKKYYERIQGIVMDTRHLMYHYAGKPLKEKAALAECIEIGLMRRGTAAL